MDVGSTVGMAENAQPGTVKIADVKQLARNFSRGTIIQVEFEYEEVRGTWVGIIERTQQPGLLTQVRYTHSRCDDCVAWSVLRPNVVTSIPTSGATYLRIDTLENPIPHEMECDCGDEEEEEPPKKIIKEPAPPKKKKKNTARKASQEPPSQSKKLATKKVVKKVPQKAPKKTTAQKKATKPRPQKNNSSKKTAAKKNVKKTKKK